MAELQLERDSRGRKVCKNSAMSDELKTQIDEFRDLARELKAYEDESRFNETVRKVAPKNPSQP